MPSIFGEFHAFEQQLRKIVRFHGPDFDDTDPREPTEDDEEAHDDSENKSEPESDSDP